MNWKKELIEKWADIEHKRWSKWQKYMHSLCTEIPTENGKSLFIPAEQVKRSINGITFKL